MGGRNLGTTLILMIGLTFALTNQKQAFSRVAPFDLSDCFVVLMVVSCDCRNSKELCLSLWLTTKGTILTSFCKPLALLLKSLHLKNRTINT